MYEIDGSYTLVTSSPVELRDYIRQHRRESYRILYRCKTSTPMAHWVQVGTIVYAAGDMLVCIDEVGMLCENGQFKKDSKGDEPILGKIVHYGRHRKLNVLCTAQRPADVARRLTSLASEIRIFQTTEPSSLSYIAEYIGTANAEKLPGLPKYSFMVWTDEGTTICTPKGGRL